MFPSPREGIFGSKNTRNTRSYRIYGTGIFTYIYHKNQLNVGTVHTLYIDPMGLGNFEDEIGLKGTL